MNASLSGRAARERAIRVASLLEHVWEAQAEEQVKARCLEDYGDASL